MVGLNMRPLSITKGKNMHRKTAYIANNIAENKPAEEVAPVEVVKPVVKPAVKKVVKKKKAVKAKR